jgi:CRISPR/Cas system CSM-associated protein Csm3 (group 7 of RAMP superfamily)
MLVQIDYVLTFATPFHLGTGITAGMIDRTVIRDADDYLYVPASTLKGVLREHCEQLCRFYIPGAQVSSPHVTDATLVEYSGTPTLISRIFGSPLHPGGLRFDDAKQVEATRTTTQEVQTSTLTQVRIDRGTRTAVDDALYTSEFGASFLTFEGTIKGQLQCTPVELPALPTDEQGTTALPTYSLLLLLAGLLMVERLGGNKSTGKGQCDCHITQVRLDGKRYGEELWRSWLAHLEVLSNFRPREKAGQS